MGKFTNQAVRILVRLIFLSRLTNWSPGGIIYIIVTFMLSFRYNIVREVQVVDLELLNNKIEEINIPIATIAEKLGLSRQSLYRKLRGERDFRASEVLNLCNILRLTTEEKYLIFFGIDFKR